MWAIEAYGALAGVAGYAQAEGVPDLWLLGIIVPREQRRRGIGAEVYNQLEAKLRKHGAKQLLTSVHIQQCDGQRFVAQRGFHPIGSTYTYRLRVAAANLTGLTDPDALVAKHGLRFVTLDRFPRKGLAARLLPLWNRTRPDQPHYWPYLPYHAQRFEREMLEPPEVALQHSFALIGGDGQAAALALQACIENGCLYSTYLAIDPSFRGRGLARALKHKLVVHAQAHGIEWLLAENDARNTAMRRINEQLGYQQAATLVMYHKLLANKET